MSVFSRAYERLCQHANRLLVCCTNCGFSFSICATCPGNCPECGGSLEVCRHTASVHQDEK
jgi:hypothetical protein